MRLGIRVQLGVALAALLLLAFLPLYFAVANLTRASMASARDASARSLGRVIAAHVGEAREARGSDVGSLLEAQLGQGGVAAIAVYGHGGVLERRAGEVASLPVALDARGERVEPVQTRHGRALLISVPRGELAVAVVVRTDASTTPTGPLVRLFALYTGVVGVGLLVFAYIAMTRLVVRPVDRLSRAARRVADGARRLEAPTSAARELAELGEDIARMTERLRADEEELRRRVDEATRHATEIQRAQESLVRSERLASVGRLSAGLAHEIGNPLAAILGFQELLLDADLPPEEAREFLVRMKKETERIHGILRELLDFARPVAAGDEGPASRAEPCDVAAAARDVAALVRPQKALRDVELVLDVAGDLPLVGLAAPRLVQVLLNLLLNAADATKSRVVLRIRRADAGVTIEVEDDGPGVAEAVREHLFEPFVTTKDVGKGTGLGLAVCRGVVESAGGTIALAAPGKLGGARFVVELRASAALVQNRSTWSA